MKNIVFNKRGSAIKLFFKDLLNRDDTLDIEVNVPLENRVLNAVRMVHTSQTIRRVIDLPGQALWFDMKPIRAFADEISNFIFISESLAFINLATLKRIKKEYPQSRFILLMMDAYHADVRNLLCGRKLIDNFPWNLAMSFDPADCEEFGFKNLELKYYDSPVVFDGESEIKTDLSFVGGAQNKDTRVPVIREVYRKMKEAGLKCEFVITNWPDEHDGIRYEPGYLAYEEFVRIESESNCILEILKEHQHANTARYFEAVVLNRKILTNNPYLKELPFYDERYMKYFETPDDIDTEWVRKKEKIDYHYDGSFSSDGIPDLIRKYLG